MSALNKQEGGTHYKDMQLQPWEVLHACQTPEQHAGYLLGTAIAYLLRYNSEGEAKGGIKDVKKAIHTLERMVEVAEGVTEKIEVTPWPAGTSLKLNSSEWGTLPRGTRLEVRKFRHSAMSYVVIDPNGVAWDIPAKDLQLFG